MCRNIKPLFNFEPPATKNEIHEASLQFVRKVSGYTHPSHVNEAPFHEAVEDIEKILRKLLKSLETERPQARPRDPRRPRQGAREGTPAPSSTRPRGAQGRRTRHGLGPYSLLRSG